MLIQFSVKNYKTFAEEAKLSMVANHDKTTRFAENVFQVPKYNLNLLKSAVVYGANASGKTKLVEAFAFMRGFVRESAKQQSDDTIPVQPFRLSTETENEPSMFEIVFIQEGVLYRYGFEVTEEKVMSEWLYYKPKTKEIELFYRFEQNFGEVHKDFKVQDLIKRKRVLENTLLLSVADSANESIAKKIFSWFTQFNVIYGLREIEYMHYTISRLENEIYKTHILTFLESANLEIEDLYTVKLPELNVQNSIMYFIKKFVEDKKVYTKRAKYDENKRRVGQEEFAMLEDESTGTAKYFALSAPILDSLENGNTLVIDELDAKLHPNLVEKIVQLFNSPTTNPKNAQLIFNTHNTNLLGANLFRRDQIWFVKKDRYGTSTLYSLASFKTDEVRKDDNYENKYIEGRYGAVPYLQEFEKYITNKTNN
ncbi:MAG: ATP-binding protein [Bacteroidetes bacterium]|nr:MAG: ATP-binding protein [Bacteroidota bacterium]